MYLNSSLYFFIMIISFVISLIVFPFFIKISRNLKYGQSIRSEGPKSHFKKSGTPTMGGIIFILIYFVLLTFMYLTETEYMSYEYYILLVFPVLFGMIGFVDDILIIINKNNNGMKPSVKFGLQLALALVYYYIYTNYINDTTLYFVYWEFDLKSMYSVLVLLMFVSTTNAVNLTDGLDGLCAGITLIILTFVSYILYVEDLHTIFLANTILIGALLGFIVYNKHPAKVFMGDTGSLFIGAYLVSLFILTKIELFLLIFGLIFIIETLSVIIQVTYFKRTNGKRIFRMTPIHHHFEQTIGEVNVVFLFYLITIITSLIAISLYNIDIYA